MAKEGNRNQVGKKTENASTPPNSTSHSYTMGKFKLSHRIVLAPLSRLRSYNDIPQSHAILYYSQRTSNGGFHLAEATKVSWILWFMDKEQVEAWKLIVHAFHQKTAEDFTGLAKYESFNEVEIHGAHGYLIDQFMKDKVNDRTDQYGDSNPDAQGIYMAEALNKYGILYLHEVEPRMKTLGEKQNCSESLLPMRKAFR